MANLKPPKKPLPCDECGGQCCRYAPIEIRVWERVRHKCPPDAQLMRRWEGTPADAVIAMKPDSDGECAFLQGGRCSIYSMRPRSCRALGWLFPCGYVDPEGAQRIAERYLQRCVSTEGIVKGMRDVTSE